ncbi:hypothetical protein ABW21_db0209304 [Orbilia brochopaga]|nr:hypothetical protein ABW21_db0209304 [Drechslerella brochopaga]
MRAFILAQMPSAGTNPHSSPLSEALALCNELAFRKPPPKETETIRLLEMTYTYLGKKAEIGRLHEHLYKTRIATPGRTKPVDEAGLQEWYNGCMKACDWAGMQKAAMMLQKQFPNNRVYYFWAIAACFVMVGNEAKPSRAIRTAAELQLFYEVLSFTKAEDAELVKYLESTTTGFHSRLGSDNYWELWWLLVDSKLRLGDFKSVNEHCLSVLSTGTVSFDGESADGPGADQPKVSKVWQDDWKVWSGYVTSAFELGLKNLEDPLFNKAAALVTENLNLNESVSRGALLAGLKFSAMCGPHASLTCRKDVPTLLAACLTFFQKQGGKSSCYDDLRPYVAQLPVDERKELLVKMKEYCMGKDLESSDMSLKELTNAVRERVTGLKFRFWIEIDDQERRPETSELNDFLQECFAVYTVSLQVDIDLLVTDMRIGDELLLLVAKGLMCIYASRQHSTLPLRIAIIVLEHLVSNSKHNFTALLLLTRLYAIIGALSCATIEYQRLSIKQIQNDSLSHHLLTRLSTLLPFANSAAAKLLHPTDVADVGLHVPANPTDSLEMYDISLRLYKNANRTNPEMISLAFKNDAYGQIKDMVLFEKRVSTSISACHFEIEKRRVLRFRGIAAEGSGALWDRALTSSTSDNRSFDLFGEDGWHTGCDMGPRVGSQWAKGFLLAESIVATLVAQSQVAAAAGAADLPKDASSSASSSSKTNGSISENEHVSLPQRLRGVINQAEMGGSECEFTRIERHVLGIVCLLGDIQVESENTSRSSSKIKALLIDLASKFESVRGSLQASSITKEVPATSTLDAAMSELSLADGDWDSAPWYCLHRVYMFLEVCKYILQLCEFLDKSPAVKALKPPITKAQITGIKNMIGSSSKSVIQMAKEQAKDAVLVTEADIDAVLSCRGLELASMAEFLKSTVGRGKVESYMDKIARSRSSTWAAVGSVKFS